MLTGDVVDQDNKFFESFGPLRRGLERLGKAGIQSFAVAGNHDYDVLPSLHEALHAEGFHLVGIGRKWEAEPLKIEGEPHLYFVGWSFPTPTMTASPLGGIELPDTDLPVLGLLHGDLHQQTSNYVPLQLADLKGVDVSAWLLGHIHKPGRWSHREGLVLYPGSPQPLGLREPGLHGPWVLDVEPGGRVTANQVPLSTLRYEALDVDLEGVSTKDDFRKKVTSSIEEHIDEIFGEHAGLKRLVCVLCYTGRTAAHRDIREWDLEVPEDMPFDGLTVTVSGSAIQTRPHLDIQKLATGNDPLGRRRQTHSGF